MRAEELRREERWIVWGLARPRVDDAAELLGRVRKVLAADPGDAHYATSKLTRAFADVVEALALLGVGADELVAWLTEPWETGATMYAAVVADADAPRLDVA